MNTSHTTKQTRLTDIRVQEVSLVDHAANLTNFCLRKNQAPTAFAKAEPVSHAADSQAETPSFTGSKLGIEPEARDAMLTAVARGIDALTKIGTALQSTVARAGAGVPIGYEGAFCEIASGLARAVLHDRSGGPLRVAIDALGEAMEDARTEAKASTMRIGNVMVGKGQKHVDFTDITTQARAEIAVEKKRPQTGAIHYQSRCTAVDKSAGTVDFSDVSGEVRRERALAELDALREEVLRG